MREVAPVYADPRRERDQQPERRHAGRRDRGAGGRAARWWRRRSAACPTCSITGRWARSYRQATPTLAAALIAALDHPPDGAQARQLVLDRYGIDQLVHDLDALYRDLLAKKKPPKN
ncbi:MAG: hypothetical protein U0703_01985 [Anaerolineae bacterium]